MDIIKRNFYTLLRSAAFNTRGNIEPMSASKWDKLHQLALTYEVVPLVYNGLQMYRDDFFLQLSDEQWEMWEKYCRQHPLDDKEEKNELLRADSLTNPKLKRKLTQILQQTPAEKAPTQQLLLYIISNVRHILYEGVSLKQLIALGTFLRSGGQQIDYPLLNEWLQQLKMRQMATMIGGLLVEGFGFSFDEIPFMRITLDKKTRIAVQEILDLDGGRMEEWYFEQGNHIFIKNSNSSAMIWRVSHSAKYFRYYPSESVTSFFTNFIHSLSHVEE